VHPDNAKAALDGRSILAVFAHPDDESLACGGTLARLADAGARVVLLCASRGERGSIHGPMADNALAIERAREIVEAARVLGLSSVVLLDHPDGDLRWARIAMLHADIVFAVRRFRPDVVITFGGDGLYWHADHIGVHERTTTAVRSLGAEAPPLYYVTMRRGVMRAVVDRAAERGWQPTPKGFWSLAPDAFGVAAEPPTFEVDVSDWVGRKLAALRCHRSQMGADHPFNQIDEGDARRWLGVELFRRAPTASAGQGVLETIGRPCT
jgi:N-acetyl-1-D-myo-inositol-2-amino-2-deoxy-alpha-D-glucopyranoside deacetylase